MGFHSVAPRQSETCPEASPTLFWLQAGHFVKLKGEHLPQTQVMCTLPAHFAEKHPYDIMLLPPCFTIEVIISRERSSALLFFAGAF